MMLKEVKPVSLILTHENGRTIEFNIDTLVSMTRTYNPGMPGQVVRNTLEITLEYTEMLPHNKRELSPSQLVEKSLV